MVELVDAGGDEIAEVCAGFFMDFLCGVVVDLYDAVFRRFVMFDVQECVGVLVEDRLE